MNKELYEEELKQIEWNTATIREMNIVNIRLKKFNWAFLHPYSQGMDIEVLKNILDTSQNPSQDILHFFASRFLDFPRTIDYIDGYFITRPYLKDYIQTIKESVVLCLQKDFKGSISILLPVIEGTLRKCIIAKKGDNKKNEIDIKELLKVFNILTAEYVNLQKKYLEKRCENYLKSGKYLDQNQEKQILIRYRNYFKLWIEQLKEFLQNQLYLNTKDNEVIDLFNRHLIVHALDDNIEFTFSNYLRLFNCLPYLSWIIGVTTEGCSLFSVSLESEVRSKWADYLSILVTSEALIETKSNLYGKQVESFKQYMDASFIRAISKQEQKIRKTIKKNDFLKK